MNEDLNRRPTTGQPAATPAARLPVSEGMAPGAHQLPLRAAVPTARPATGARPRIWPGMPAEQLQTYIEGTKKRRSRQKPRPSLDKHRDNLLACVKGNAVMKQVFEDLTAADPAVLEEFGPDGYRAFNACVKRLTAG
jgi:hypothetical protein